MNKVQVSLEEAVAICQQEVGQVSATKVKLERAAGRICADQYHAVHNIPGFDRSRVDGYAVNKQDVNDSGQHSMLQLSAVGSIRAGEYIQAAVNLGETWRIMTGAILPLGCGAVVKQEEAEIISASVIINKEITLGENIEKQGSSISAGTILASSGQRLQAADLERLASAGYTEIKVYRHPAVYLIQTGDELVMPGQQLPAGKIFNSNRSQFFALILSRGARPLAGEGPAGDCMERLIDEITRAAENARLVIITGGTQQGDHDLVRTALYKLKARQLFAGINIRPGLSTSAWFLKGALVFNLPGNPGGGYLLFHALIRPVLNQLSGLRPANEKWLPLPVDQTSIRISAQRYLKREVLIIAPDGQCQLVSPRSWAGQPGWEVIADISGAPDKGTSVLRCLPVSDLRS